MDSDPVSPRTRSPSLSDHGRDRDHDHDHDQPASPDHSCNASLPREHTQAAGGSRAGLALKSPAGGLSKGKGKARGPLRLLDLPVDVLKEIIHQVRSPRSEPAEAHTNRRLRSSPTPTT